MLSRFKLFTLLGLASVFILTGAACESSSGTLGRPEPITLEWWTVFKNPQDIQPLIDAYEAQFPYVTINVRNLRYDTFETTLLEALAEDKGPDIFTVHNTAVQKHLTKTLPMPATTNMKVAVERGTLSKNVFTELRSFPSFSPRYLNDTFLDQVLRDTYISQQLHGVALSVDTLALFYNKDLLANAGIPIPARNYAELQDHVLKLTRQSSNGSIIQSGIALGTSTNVERFVDIISLLMMQNGTLMTDDIGNATFDQLPTELRGRATLPAADALIYYADFAAPNKVVYTWNETKPNSLQAFMNGSVAYFMGYAYHRPMIATQAPKLNYGVASMPQIEGNTRVNFANYWVEVVSAKTRYPDEAWNFLQYIARPDNARIYLTEAQLPTATKTLIAEQSEDVTLGVFVDQLLTARSWYRGKNPDALNEIFGTMLKDLDAGVRIEELLRNAVSKVNQTLR